MEYLCNDYCEGVWAWARTNKKIKRRIEIAIKEWACITITWKKTSKTKRRERAKGLWRTLKIITWIGTKEELDERTWVQEQSEARSLYKRVTVIS